MVIVTMTLVFCSGSVSDIGRNIGSFVIPVYEGVVKDCWFPVGITDLKTLMRINICLKVCIVYIREYIMARK
jgi:hypothetical protein